VAGVVLCRRSELVSTSQRQLVASDRGANEQREFVTISDQRENISDTEQAVSDKRESHCTF